MFDYFVVKPRKHSPLCVCSERSKRTLSWYLLLCIYLSAGDSAWGSKAWGCPRFSNKLSGWEAKLAGEEYTKLCAYIHPSLSKFKWGETVYRTPSHLFSKSWTRADLTRYFILAPIKSQINVWYFLSFVGPTTDNVRAHSNASVCFQNCENNHHNVSGVTFWDSFVFLYPIK